MKASLLSKCLVLAWLSCACLTVRCFHDRHSLAGHLVDDGALGAIVGDGNFFCGSISCSQALGSPVCYFCADDDYRLVCCDGGTQNCAYTGTQETCGHNTTRMKGMASGNPGTCGVISCGDPVPKDNCNDYDDADCT
jgi:hypothetical protein